MPLLTSNQNLRLGGVEAGGTSFRVIIASGIPTNVLHRLSLPTTTPEETIPRVAKQLFEWGVDTIGVASFGPVDLDPNSDTYGFITSTPKQKWVNCDLLGGIRRELVRLATEQQAEQSSTTAQTVDLVAKYKSIPMGFQTDVNAAAAVEMLYGAYTSVSSLCYITIGTGIGVGIAMRRKSDNDDGVAVRLEHHHLVEAHVKRPISMITNMLHPEAGHVIVLPHKNETIPGLCPFHGGRCCEGLSNNHAVATRAGVNVQDLANIPEDHPTWEITAWYIAQLCMNLILVISPEKIIIGGGLAQNPQLIDHVRRFVEELLNGYIQAPPLKDINQYISTSTFSNNEQETNISSGIVGALYLAHAAAHHQDDQGEIE